MISPGSTSFQAKKEPGAYMRAGLPLPNPAGSDRLEVHRCIFAATIDIEFEFEPVALVECRQTRPLARRDMHEGTGMAVTAMEEVEALHRETGRELCRESWSKYATVSGSAWYLETRAS